MKETAFGKACKAIESLGLDGIGAKTGAKVHSGGIVSVPYFNITENITLPGFTFEPDVGDVEKILILHYLAGSGSDRGAGTYVAYGNLRGGMFYHKTFARRGPERIRRAFEAKAHLLVEAARSIGGTEESFPDISARIPVFPKADVIVTLTLGDEEFGSQANILFKDDIVELLSLEDIAFVGDVVAKKLCEAI